MSLLSTGPCCKTLGPIAPRKNKDPSKTDKEHGVLNITVSVERWRLIAYICFWAMCAFATACHNIWVKDMLAAGPSDGNTCPPFSRNNEKLGVSPGKGFDVDTQSHLIQAFTYNNICVNWDYSPSRELTAMVYPTFEYSVLVYVCLNFVSTLLANLRGELEPWVWTASKIMFPLTIILATQFRMIFVIIAYEDVAGHTAGYVGLQLALLLIALQNVLVVWDCDIAYDFLDWFGGPEKRHRNTRIASLIYMFGLVLVSGWKIVNSAIFVFTGAVPFEFGFSASGIPGMTVNQVMDIVWMIFNAVLPMLIAYKRSKADHPIEVLFRQKVVYDGDDSEETTPLRSS